MWYMLTRVSREPWTKHALSWLYRKIKDASDQDNSSELVSASEELPYDTELEVRVEKDGEVVTAHFCSFNKLSSRKQEEMKERLKNAYYALNKQYKRAFEEVGQDLLELKDEEKNTRYESQASAWYQVTYHPRWLEKFIETKDPDGELVPPRLSFAWIPADYLVRDKGKVGGGKPIDSLASYLSERIWS